MPEASWQELAGLLCACCPNLAALHFNSSDIDSAFVRMLKLPRLSTLEVHDYYAHTVSHSIDAMISAIGSLPSLEHLRLEEIGITMDDDHVIIDVTPLASLSCLQGLSLLRFYEGSINGLGAVLQSCSELEHLALEANYIPPTGVPLFSNSLKCLELVNVTLSHGLPDVLHCFPSIQKVIMRISVELHDGVLGSEEVVAAVAHCIWQSCSVLSAWPVDNHGAKFLLSAPSLRSSDLRLHAYSSLLRALAPLKGSSFVSSTTGNALQLCFRFYDSGVMAAL